MHEYIYKTHIYHAYIHRTSLHTYVHTYTRTHSRSHAYVRVHRRICEERVRLALNEAVQREELGPTPESWTGGEEPEELNLGPREKKRDVRGFEKSFAPVSFLLLVST